MIDNHAKVGFDIFLDGNLEDFTDIDAGNVKDVDDIFLYVRDFFNVPYKSVINIINLSPKSM